MRPLLCLVVAGCAGFQPFARSSRGHLTGLHESYRGQPICQTDLGRGDGSVSAYREDLQLELPRGEVIHRVMCTGEPRGHFDEELYAAFDDDHFDPVDAALIVTLCVASGECDSSQARSGELARRSYSRLATTYWYAKHVDLQALAVAVDKLALPGELREGFVRRATACIAHVVAAVDNTHERWKAIYVDPMEVVRVRRAADRAALASHGAAFGKLKPRVDAALIDHRVSTALRDEVIAARDRYVTACLGRARSALYCLTGPIARPLTELLARIAIELGDATLAAAEDATLRMGPDQSDLRYEQHVAVDKAMRAETARFVAYREAVAAGADRAVVASRFGETSPLDLTDYANLAGLTPPRVEQRRVPHPSDEVERIQRIVERVERRGAIAIVSFRDIVEKLEHRTNCHETGKLERITRDGELQYRVECSGPWVTELEHDRVAPISVSALEAEHVKPGETVLAVAAKHGRTGYVVQVLGAGGEPVQLRAFRDAAR